MKGQLTYETRLPFPLWAAHALVSILQVDAGPTVKTRTGRAFIQIYKQNSVK